MTSINTFDFCKYEILLNSKLLKKILISYVKLNKSHLGHIGDGNQKLYTHHARLGNTQGRLWRSSQCLEWVFDEVHLVAEYLRLGAIKDFYVFGAARNVNLLISNIKCIHATFLKQHLYKKVLACVSPIKPKELSRMNSFSFEMTISMISFDVSISLSASFKHSDLTFSSKTKQKSKFLATKQNRLRNSLLTFIIILLITLSNSKSKLTKDSVSMVLTLHSVIIPLSSNL